MKRYTLTTPVNVLGVLHQQVGLDYPVIDLENNTIAVKAILFTTPEEQTGSFSRTVTISGADYTSVGFKEGVFLNLLKTALNVS